MLRKTSLPVATACATLLWAGTSLATPTPQQKCDNTRITAWKVYQACVDTVVAKDAKAPNSFDESAAFAKCRHRYFKNWTAFQSKASLSGSTCALGLAYRFTDNVTTATDNLTGLVWEKKTNKDGTRNDDPHDADNVYTWSTGMNNEDSTVFTTFLTVGLNTPAFAGASGWRLPTLAELQSIVLDFACSGAFGGGTCQCGSDPCVAFDAANTPSGSYWSTTSYVPDPSIAWGVTFHSGLVFRDGIKTGNEQARAVRGGF